METLWQAVVHGTQAVHPQVNSTGRLGYEYYDKLGYVPYDVKINESVARTLEYAYDDWCICQLGKALDSPGDGQALYASSDGYCGDEDNGQTSAWYVFSAMGVGRQRDAMWMKCC